MQCYSWRYNGATIYMSSDAFSVNNKSLYDFYLAEKDLYYKLEKFLKILDKLSTILQPKFKYLKFISF